MSTTKKRIPWFWISLLVFALCCAAGVFFALERLWIELVSYQKQYDAAQPETAITEYFSRIEKREFDQILTDANFEADEWNTPADYVSWLRTLYGQTPTSYECRPIGGGVVDGPGKPWAVLDGERHHATIYLEQSTNENGDARWVVRTPPDYQEGFDVEAPEYAVVFVNGAPLSPEDATGHTFVPSFLVLTDDTPTPKVLQYKTPRLLGESVFSAMGQAGEICRLDEDKTARTVDVTIVPFDVDIELYESLMEQAVRAYAEFIAKDGAFSAFSQHVYTQSKFYDSVRTFDNSWYIDHNSHTFENWKFENITRHSENSFVGDVSFDYVVMQGTKEHRFPSSYRMSFLEIDGDFKLVNLEVK